MQLGFRVIENIHVQAISLIFKATEGEYYEQTKINGIEVIYVVDWLLQSIPKKLKIFTALLVINIYAGARFLMRAKESK